VKTTHIGGVIISQSSSLFSEAPRDFLIRDKSYQVVVLNDEFGIIPAVKNKSAEILIISPRDLHKF
jgi:hypothetical protein